MDIVFGRFYILCLLQLNLNAEAKRIVCSAAELVNKGILTLSDC